MRSLFSFFMVFMVLCSGCFPGYGDNLTHTAEEIIYNPIFNLFESTPPIDKPFTIILNLPEEYRINAIKLTIKESRTLSAQNDPEQYKRIAQYEWKYNNFGKIEVVPGTQNNATKKYEIRIPIRLDENIKPWFSEFFIFRFEWRFHFEPESYVRDYLGIDTQLKAIYSAGKKIQQDGGSTPGGKSTSQFICDEIVALFGKYLLNNTIALMNDLDLKSEINTYLNTNKDYLDVSHNWLENKSDDEKGLNTLISLLLNHLNVKIKILILKADVNLSNYNYTERQKKRIQLGVGIMYPFVSNDYLFPCLNYEVKFIPGCKNRPLYSNGYFSGLLRSLALEFGISTEQENMKNGEVAMKGVYESLFFHAGIGFIILDPIRISGGVFMFTSLTEETNKALDFTPYASISIDIDVFNWLAEFYTKNKTIIGGSL